MFEIKIKNYSRISKIERTKALQSQSRKIISNVIKFITEEASKGVFITDINKINEGVNATTDLSKLGFVTKKAEK